MKKTHKAILVDDEQSARDILAKLLEKFCPQIEIIDKCCNLEEAVKVIKKHQPELVFLDIEMPNYAGYEIVSFFDKIDFEIIFTTAYDHYAIKAFEISAVDYLLKPIDIERLKLSIARFEEKSELRSMQNAYKVLRENLNKSKLTKIVIPIHGEQKVIPVKEILAFEAQEAYSAIYVLGGDRYVASKNVKHFEKLLNDHNNFFRSHKSWLINVDYIKTYSKSELIITLSNDIVTKLSKYRKTDFDTKFSLKS